MERPAAAAGLAATTAVELKVVSISRLSSTLHAPFLCAAKTAGRRCSMTAAVAVASRSRPAKKRPGPQKSCSSALRAKAVAAAASAAAHSVGARTGSACDACCILAPERGVPPGIADLPAVAANRGPSREGPVAASIGLFGPPNNGAVSS